MDLNEKKQKILPHEAAHDDDEDETRGQTYGIQ